MSNIHSRPASSDSTRHDADFGVKGLAARAAYETSGHASPVAGVSGILLPQLSRRRVVYRERKADTYDVSSAIKPKAEETEQVDAGHGVFARKRRRLRHDENSLTRAHPRAEDAYVPPETLPKNFRTPLTCFYWAQQGSCSKSDEECLYAHYHTGHVAAAPARVDDHILAGTRLQAHLSSANPTAPQSGNYSNAADTAALTMLAAQLNEKANKLQEEDRQLSKMATYLRRQEARIQDDKDEIHHDQQRLREQFHIAHETQKAVDAAKEEIRGKRVQISDKKRALYDILEESVQSLESLADTTKAAAGVLQRSVGEHVIGAAEAGTAMDMLSWTIQRTIEQLQAFL